MGHSPDPEENELTASSRRYSSIVLTIAGDASRDVVSNASGPALVALAVLFVVAALGAWWIAQTHMSSHGSVAWFAALGSVAGCVSLTLLREGLHFGFQPTSLLAWTTSGWDRLAGTDLLGSSQFLLNIALFVPAGVAWTWVTGRPLRALGGLVLLTMSIESLQGVTGAGGADVADVVANSIGAALGVGAAVIVTAALTRSGLATSDSAGSDPSSPRRRAFAACALVVAVTLTAAGLVVGANRRQTDIHEQLESTLAESTYDEIDEVVRGDSDNPDRFEPDAVFVDFDQILNAISVRADGFRYTDDQIEIRWPALFFGFRRCVYVIWTPSGVVFRDMSGKACTDFIG